jgi:hypothetical protein
MKGLLLLAMLGGAVTAWHGPSCEMWRGHHGLGDGFVIGALSGFNIACDGPDVLAGLDVEAVFAWVDQYCAQHPLDPLMTAVRALLKERGSHCS